MFEIKTFEQITKDMIEWTQANTNKIRDFNVGSKVRTIYESVAIVMEEFYYKVWQGLKVTIEEGVYILYNFNLLPALRATGYVTFSRTDTAPADYTIPVNTIVQTEKSAIRDAIQYETTQQVILLTGNTEINAPIRAVKEGKLGNVEANKIVNFVTKPTGIDTVTNEFKLITGRDRETRDERRKRFSGFLMSLHKATKPALEYAAKEVVGVHDAKVVENPELKVFYHNTTLGTFTDLSIYANNPYTTETPEMFPSPATGHTLNIGNLTDKFYMLFINFAVLSEDLEGVWEYFNGSTWSDLSATDGTNNFSQDGTVSFSLPILWKDSKINDEWAFWIRYRITTIGGSFVNPQMNYIFASPPPGFVDVYIQDVDGEAGSDLVDAVADNMPDYRGAGIIVNVRSPEIILQEIECLIQINTLYDRDVVEAKVENYILNYLNAFTLGENLYLAKLSSEIMNIEAGKAVISVDITTPSANILVSSGEVIRPDTANLTVTVVN